MKEKVRTDISFCSDLLHTGVHVPLRCSKASCDLTIGPEFVSQSPPRGPKQSLSTQIFIQEPCLQRPKSQPLFVSLGSSLSIFSNTLHDVEKASYHPRPPFLVCNRWEGGGELLLPYRGPQPQKVLGSYEPLVALRRVGCQARDFLKSELPDRVTSTTVPFLSPGEPPLLGSGKENESTQHFIPQTSECSSVLTMRLPFYSPGYATSPGISARHKYTEHLHM